MAKKIVPVNLYNPHAEPDNEKKKHPEMCTYQVPREFDLPRFNAEDDFEPRLNITTGGRVMFDSNLDRFGLPIRPTKPICLVPGPDHYPVGMHAYAAVKEPTTKVPVNGYINRELEPRVPFK